MLDRGLPFSLEWVGEAVSPVHSAIKRDVRIRKNKQRKLPTVAKGK